MNISKTIISLSTLPIITGAFLASAALSPVFANPSCDAETDLQGSVNGNEATVTNHSSNEDCSYDATLAIYNAPNEPETNGWIEAQTLIDSQTKTVNARETVSFKVEGTGTACWNQSDLIRGKEVFLTNPVYRTAMDTDVYKVNENNCNVTVTTTTTTNNNTTTNDNSSTTSTSNSPVSATQLAATGNLLAIYASLLAGAFSLIAGLILRKTAK